MFRQPVGCGPRGIERERRWREPERHRAGTERRTVFCRSSKRCSLPAPPALDYTQPHAPEKVRRGWGMVERELLWLPHLRCERDPDQESLGRKKARHGLPPRFLAVLYEEPIPLVHEYLGRLT